MHRRKAVPGAGLCPGITLMELVAVLAVLAILAAVAWPGYTELIRKGRRMDAVTSLYRVQMEQERYRAANHRYAERLTELGWAGDEADSREGYYRIRLEPVADPRLGFRALAVPGAGTDQARDRCGAFAYSDEGPDPQAPADPACWPR